MSDQTEWVTATGARHHNGGGWVEEPTFLGSDPARSPDRGKAATLGPHPTPAGVVWAEGYGSRHAGPTPDAGGSGVG